MSDPCIALSRIGRMWVHESLDTTGSFHGHGKLVNGHLPANPTPEGGQLKNTF
jgi:hypothetical protein